MAGRYNNPGGMFQGNRATNYYNRGFDTVDAIQFEAPVYGSNSAYNAANYQHTSPTNAGTNSSSSVEDPSVQSLINHKFFQPSTLNHGSIQPNCGYQYQPGLSYNPYQAAYVAPVQYNQPQTVPE